MMITSNQWAAGARLLLRAKCTHFPPLQLDFASAYAKKFSILQEHSSILTLNYVRFCLTIFSFLLFLLHPFNSPASLFHVLKTNRVTNSTFLSTGPAHSPHPLILSFFLNSFSFFNIRLLQPWLGGRVLIDLPNNRTVGDPELFSLLMEFISLMHYHYPLYPHHECLCQNSYS